MTDLNPINDLPDDMPWTEARKILIERTANTAEIAEDAAGVERGEALQGHETRAGAAAPAAA